jgi:hypothetical protein
MSPGRESHVNSEEGHLTQCCITFFDDESVQCVIGLHLRATRVQGLAPWFACLLVDTRR